MSSQGLTRKSSAMSLRAKSETREFFELVVDFFEEFSWVYDFKATEILTASVKATIPLIFVEYFQTLKQSDERFLDILNLIDNNEIGWPKELLKFTTTCRNLRKLSESVKGSFISNQTVSKRAEKLSLPKKWSLKKYLEVVQVGNFVGELSVKENCALMVDIGSGLGYLSSHLANQFEIPVLGVESESSRVETAKKNFLQSASNVKQQPSISLNYICLRITENISVELGPHLEGYDKVCLTALHACGDLTPWSLRYFVSSENLKCIAVVPCCYHKMDVTGENFPMSLSLKSSLSRSDNLDFLKNAWLWRLASQRSGSKFLLDINKETKNLFYRALLEKYTTQGNLKLVKKKRNIVVPKCETFAEYAIGMIGMEGAFNIVSDKGSLLGDELEKVLAQLNQLHIEESRWDLVITGILAMQGAIQSIAEDLILFDRLAFLEEDASVKVSGLSRVIANDVSPRGMVLYGIKN